MSDVINTKIELIRLFLKYPISSIPIVNEKKGLIGFLSKQDIIASSGVQADIPIPITEVIEHHLNPIDREKDLPGLNLLLKNFNKVKRIPVMDKMGNIVDMWEKIQLITAWEGEEERGKSNFYPLLFDHFPLGVVITSPKHKILYINQPAVSMSNVRGKKIGRDFKEVFNSEITPPVLRKKFGNLIFSAGYIKEEKKIIGIIYIITKEDIPS